MAESHSTSKQVVDSVEDQIELKCDIKKSETSISGLGEIVEVEVPVNVPCYATCQKSFVVTREQGRAPDAMEHPIGVAIHEDTHHIFIADSHNDRVKLFSETGEFLYQLGVGDLSYPCGIAIHGDSVYVCCLGDHSVCKFSMNELCSVRRIGGRDQTTDNLILLDNSQLIPSLVCLLQINITTGFAYTTQISTISVTSRINPYHNHPMLKYLMTVCTYCVHLATSVFSYST